MRYKTRVNKLEKKIMPRKKDDIYITIFSNIPRPSEVRGGVNYHYILYKDVCNGYYEKVDVDSDEGREVLSKYKK